MRGRHSSLVWLLRYRRFPAAVVAIAFAFLVSVAATHLHITPDQDEACAVCTAFAGKLEGPSKKLVVPTYVLIELRVATVVAAPSVTSVAVVVLPPSCGPPAFLLA
jgi:hypothetical protein